MTSQQPASSFQRAIPAHRARADRRTVGTAVALRVGLAEIKAGLEGAGDKALRLVRVSNISDTGLRLDGLQDECGDIVAGDLVSLRLETGGPLMLGTVVRVVPDVGPGAIVIGVHLISSRFLLEHA